MLNLLAGISPLELLSAALLGMAVIGCFWLPVVGRWQPSAMTARGGGVRGSLAARLERLAGPTRQSFWEDQLRRAAIPLRPGELYGLALLICAASTVLLNTWLGYPLLSLGGGLALGAVPLYLVLRRANQQERAFLDLLKSTCMMLAGAALSGASPERLLVLLSRANPPLGDYFSQIVQQVPSLGRLEAVNAVAAKPHPPQLDTLLQVFQLYFSPGAGGSVAGQFRAVAEDIALDIRLSDTFRIKLERIRYQYWLVIGLAGVLLLDLRLQEPEIAHEFLASLVGQVYLLVLASFALLMGWGLRRLTRLPGISHQERRRDAAQGKGGIS